MDKVQKTTFTDRLRVFGNKVLRRIFGHKREKVTECWRKMHNEKLHNWFSSPVTIKIIKSRRMRLGNASSIDGRHKK
jgi:hypothetical protein